MTPDLGPPLARLELSDPEADLKAYLVVDRLASGLCVGGIRMAPNVSLLQMERLARLMTLKFGAMGVQIGGGKAGVVGSRSSRQAGPVLRRFGELLEPFLRSWYLAGEDLGTGAAELTMIYDHLGLDPIALVRSRMAAQGRPLQLRGDLRLMDLFSEDFGGQLAGRGVVVALLAAAEMRGLQATALGASVQGFGSVGQAVARHLVAAGITVVAVADREGVVCSPGGLDVEDLAQARSPEGVIDRRRLRRAVTLLRGEDWCRIPAEVLIPAAVEDAITLEQAERIHGRVRIVVEGANAPIPDEVERLLEARGIWIVPDFIANAGSAAAFGLLVTGEATTQEGAVAECCRRIANATKVVLDGAVAGLSSRARAVALATRTFAGVPA